MTNFLHVNSKLNVKKKIENKTTTEFIYESIELMWFSCNLACFLRILIRKVTSKKCGSNLENIVHAHTNIYS